MSDLRRRRTPGLRREEVASLAGISAEWYVKLEQGRSVAPSTTTVDALSRALRLNKVEHAHLSMLASPNRQLAFVRETVKESLRRLVQSLPYPAYVTGLRWDVLAWSAPAAMLLTECILRTSRRVPSRRRRAVGDDSLGQISGLNAALCERFFVMGFHPPEAQQGGQSKSPDLSTPRAALHYLVNLER